MDLVFHRRSECSLVSLDPSLGLCRRREMNVRVISFWIYEFHLSIDGLLYWIPYSLWWLLHASSFPLNLKRAFIAIQKCNRSYISSLIYSIIRVLCYESWGVCIAMCIIGGFCGCTLERTPWDACTLGMHAPRSACSRLCGSWAPSVPHAP